MVTFNDVLLVVTGTWRYSYESPVRIRLQAKPGIIGKHHARTLSQCPQYMLSISGYSELQTVTAGSDVVQSGRPIFDDFFQHLWPYIGNNTANVVFQMVKRLWLIRIETNDFT
ncbi:hypothetical protein TNCV_3239481 [Trichonephila clavipes]|nr:hypothetical protein TNCV_3239481 [Trichonephila clavipes]